MKYKTFHHLRKFYEFTFKCKVVSLNCISNYCAVLPEKLANTQNRICNKQKHIEITSLLIIFSFSFRRKNPFELVFVRITDIVLVI